MAQSTVYPPQELLLALCATAAWRGGKSNRDNPLLVKLTEKEKGWLRHGESPGHNQRLRHGESPGHNQQHQLKQVELQLMMTLHLVLSARDIKSERTAALCAAFGIGKSTLQRQIALFFKPDNISIRSIFHGPARAGTQQLASDGTPSKSSLVESTFQTPAHKARKEPSQAWTGPIDTPPHHSSRIRRKKRTVPSTVTWLQSPLTKAMDALTGRKRRAIRQADPLHISQAGSFEEGGHSPSLDARTLAFNDDKADEESNNGDSAVEQGSNEVPELLGLGEEAVNNVPEAMEEFDLAEECQQVAQEQLQLLASQRSSTEQIAVTPGMSAVEGFEDTALLQTVAFRVLTKLASASTGQTKLQYKDRAGKRREAVVFMVPITRRGKQQANARNRKKKASGRTKKLHAYLSVLCGNNAEETLELLKMYTKTTTTYTLVSKSSEKLSVAEAICIREYVPCRTTKDILEDGVISSMFSAPNSFVRTSTNGLLRFDRALRILKNISLFPPQLKRLISRMEERSVPMECSLMILKVNATEKKPCLYIRVKNPALLIEKMVTSSIVAGKQLDSFEVSNYKKSILIFIGLDRGGGDTYLGVRCGNRKGGNQSDYCYPLAVTEEASEDSSNIRATFMHDDSAIKATVQDLLDDRLHLLKFVSKSPGGNIQAAACVTVRLVPSNEKPDKEACLSHSRMDVTITRMDDTVAQRATGGSTNDDALEIDTTTDAEDRDRASEIPLPSLRYPFRAVQTSKIKLGIQLIRHQEDGYTGFIVFDGETEVYRFCFDSPLTYSLEHSVSIECELVRGFPSNDAKCSFILSGQGSAGCVCPCLRCVEEKVNFRRFQHWMHEHRPNGDNAIEKSPTPDALLREGTKSNANSFQMFKALTGSGKFSLNKKGATADQKRTTYSVVAEPSLTMDPRKESGGPLHVSSGCVEHLLLEIRSLSRKVDMVECPLIDRIKKVAEDSLAQSKKTASNGLPAGAAAGDRTCVRDIREAQKRLQAAQARHRGDIVDVLSISENVQRCLDDVAHYQKKREEHADRSGLAAANKLIKGAGELYAIVKPFLEAMGKGERVCGESEFVFNKAIERFSNGKYRREHGGITLSNSDAINSMATYEDIAAATECCYSEQPRSQTEVKRIMKKFGKVAEPCHRITILLKSQDKWTDAKLVLLKDPICDYSVAWRNVFPDRPIFPKLHFLECMVVPYIAEHGFYGLGSEEGFESAHNKLAWIKNLLRSMPYTVDRGKKMGQRYQVNLIEEVASAWAKLQPPSRKRGKYKKPTERSGKEIMVEIESTAQLDVAEGYFKLSSGNYIRSEWKEIYEFVAYSKPTSAMTASLLGNDLISGSAEQIAKTEYGGV